MTGEQAHPERAAPEHAPPDLDIFGKPPPRGGDWSHRRGEPRIFALCWTFYLLIATVAAFWAVGSPGAHDAAALRPAARSVLAAISAGIAILWPMMRLSQAGRPVPVRVSAAWVMQDLMVLLVPAHAIIWPQIAMCSWPVGVVGALGAGLSAWAALLGGLLALALATPSPGRVTWMLVFIAMAAAGPLIGLGPAHALGDAPEFGWWWMTSPLTTGFEIARDRPWTGASAAVGPGHWRAITTVALGAGGLWLALAAWALFHRRRVA